MLNPPGLSGEPKPGGGGGYLKAQKRKVLQIFRFTGLYAEREGFEPPVPLSTPVFKTGAFDHSAISP